MRTTLQIDDDVLAAARAMAEHEQTSLGAVVSRLARRGLGSGRAEVDDGGPPRFDRASESLVVTPEDVAASLDE